MSCRRVAARSAVRQIRLTRFRCAWQAQASLAACPRSARCALSRRSSTRRARPATAAGLAPLGQRFRVPRSPSSHLPLSSPSPTPPPARTRTRRRRRSDVRHSGSAMQPARRPHRRRRRRRRQMAREARSPLPSLSDMRLASAAGAMPAAWSLSAQRRSRPSARRHWASTRTTFGGQCRRCPCRRRPSPRQSTVRLLLLRRSRRRRRQLRMALRTVCTGVTARPLPRRRRMSTTTTTTTSCCRLAALPSASHLRPCLAAPSPLSRTAT
jgi:hypothetical protein